MGCVSHAVEGMHVTLVHASDAKGMQGASGSGVSQAQRVLCVLCVDYDLYDFGCCWGTFVGLTPEEGWHNCRSGAPCTQV